MGNALPTAYSNNGFELYQNQPNPFNDKTTIGFELPKASSATLTIFDITGKIVKTIEGDYQKGYNEIELDRKEWNASGVLFYQLDAQEYSSTQKMFAID